MRKYVIIFGDFRHILLMLHEMFVCKWIIKLGPPVVYPPSNWGCYLCCSHGHQWDQWVSFYSSTPLTSTCCRHDQPGVL